MPQNLKRPWISSSRTRPVSPPPFAKRRATCSSSTASNEAGSALFRIRVFVWNVNGVAALLQKPLSFTGKSEFPLRAFLRRHDWPQILCLQEVKISSKDQSTQNQVQRAANDSQHPSEPTYIAYFSLPRDKFNATGFGGKIHGVATLIREDFSIHISKTTLPDWDLEGRVLIHELTSGVAVINGYWVNGTGKPYRNTESGVVEGTRHDHKLRFHQHMLDEALKFARTRQHVLLVGDMNVARCPMDGHPNLRTSPLQHVKNRDDFNKKFFEDQEGLNGIDVFRQLHGDRRKYTYHPRGHGWGESCDRVDLIIADSALFGVGAIKATDICDNPGDRGHSDHVPHWVELDLTKLSHNFLDST